MEEIYCIVGSLAKGCRSYFEHRKLAFGHHQSIKVEP
jgi:hypothetical protein